jgi:hypothetical protein
MGNKTLRIGFLGDPNEERAPRVGIESPDGVRSVELGDKERLVLAYLALCARHPDRRSRADVRDAVFGPNGDDDLDRVRKSLEVKLAAAGSAGAFRPYRRGADSSEGRDPRGMYSLRGVACDIADVGRMLEAGDVAAAKAEVERIRAEHGAASPLPLVDPRARRKLPARTDWYTRAVSGFEDLAREQLEWSPASSRGWSPRPGRRARWALAGVAVTAAVAVAVAGGVSIGDEGSEAGDDPSCAVGPLTEPTAADLRATAQPAASEGGPPRALPDIVTRSRPRSMAVSSQGVWLAQSTDASIWLIDPRLRRPVGQPFPVEGTPYAMAVAAEVIWVTRDDGVLVAVDRTSGEIVRSVRYAPSSGSVALGAGAVWVNNYDGRFAGGVTRIDPCDGGRERVPVGDSANTVLFAFDALWVSDSEQKAVHRIDPETLEVTTVGLDIADPQDLGAGDGYIWVVHYGPKRATRIDPEAMRRVGPPIRIGAGGAGAAVGLGALWIPNYEGDSVTRVDLRTLESDPEAVRVGDSPTDLVLGFGRAWVANNDSEPPTVTPIEP